MDLVKAGNLSTEWKITLMNYAVGLVLMGCATFLQYKGHDSTNMMALSVSFLTVNGMGYAGMRTIHKNKSLDIIKTVPGEVAK